MGPHLPQDQNELFLRCTALGNLEKALADPSLSAEGRESVLRLATQCRATLNRMADAAALVT